jgi:hypothetical protein
MIKGVDNIGMCAADREQAVAFIELWLYQGI